MNATSRQGLYRSSPLILGGLVGSFALLVAGIAIGLQIASPEQRLPLVLGMLGVFVLIFLVCGLTALRRHRWTIEAAAVSIDERPLVPLMGRRRRRRVSFGDISSLNTVANGAEEVLALTTRDGERFVLPPGLAGDGPGRKPDRQGLAAFAARLQAAMTAAGVAPPPVTDGLGFWNRTPGLALLGFTLLTSLAIAAVVLWGLRAGEITHVRAHAAAASLVALPVVVGWALRRCWLRRRVVLKAMR